MPKRVLGGVRPFSLIVCAAAGALFAPSVSAQTDGASSSALLAPPPGQAQAAVSPNVARFNRALAATRAKRYAEAERLYRQILKDEPKAAAVWANIGLLQAARGKFADAEKSLARAVQFEPTAVPFRAQLASFQYRLGRLDQSEKNARIALKRDPKNLLALATVSDVAMAGQRYADAVPVLQKLRSLLKKPDDRAEINLILALNGTGKTSQALAIARKRVARVPTASSYLILGDTLRLGGDLNGAREAYTQAQKLEPKSPGAATGLSLVAALSGDSATALRLVEQQIARSPDDARLHFQHGFLLFGQKDTSAPNDPERRARLTRAEQSFYQAATLDPKNAVYLAYAGSASLALGEARFRNAEALFRAALSLDPRNTLSRVGLAELALRQDKLDVALAQYRAVLQYAPNDMQAGRGIAGILYYQGKKDQAFREMRRLALAYPRDVVILSELGSWLVEDKRAVEASAVYEQVLMRDPKNEGAYLALARLASEAGKPEQARKWYREALAKVPQSVSAALLLGQGLMDEKKTDEALEVYRSALAATSDSSILRWQLAVTLNQLGRDEEALKEMRLIRLTDNDPNRVQYLLGPPRVYLKAEKYPEAITLLRQIAQENPGEDEVRYVLAESLRRGGQAAEAEQMLIALRDRRPVRETDPKPARPALLLGDLYEQSSRLDEAAAAYEEGLRRDPTNLTAGFGLQRVRVRQGKPDAAVEFVEQMALSDPKEPLLPAVGTLRQLHVENKTLPKYTGFTARMLQKYPGEWTATYLRARAITDEAAGAVTPAMRQEAAQLYRQILAKDKRNADAQLQLGVQYEALGQRAEAISAYRQVLQTSPQNPDAQTALKRLGDVREVTVPHLPTAPAETAPASGASPGAPTAP